MRKHMQASALLAVLAAAAIALPGCGSPAAAVTSPTPSCVNASAPHRAYVVVQHLSGTVVQRCVGFAGDTIDGQTLMDRSGIEYQTQTFSFGKAVCQVDDEPSQFTQCLPQNAPYWDLFVESGGSWSVAQTGYVQVTLHDKDALGWHYVSATDPSPAPPPAPKAAGA